MQNAPICRMMILCFIQGLRDSTALLPPPSPPFLRSNPTALPRLYGWLSTPRVRWRIKCLLDSGSSHCFIRPELARGQLGEAWTSVDRGGPLAVRQADDQARPTRGSVEVLLTLVALEEPMLLTVFDLDCDADLRVILGRPWLPYRR